LFCSIKLLVPTIGRVAARTNIEPIIYLPLSRKASLPEATVMSPVSVFWWRGATMRASVKVISALG